jgi:hypothetical protein
MMRFHIFLRGVICSWMVLGVVLAVRGQTVEGPATGPSTQPVTMRFKRYVITDEQGFKGMEVLHGVMPADWTIKGGVIWKMALVTPDLMRIHWGDAQDVCAFDIYPAITFSWSDEVGRGGRVQPGQIQHGDIIKEPPTDQFDAFEKVIVQMFRPDLKDAKVVNK